MQVDGTLEAQGSAAQPIIFTSVRDNSPMGCANTASNGDWGSLQFGSTSTNNDLEFAKVFYGGGGYGTVATVVDNGGALTFNNGVVGNSSTAGLRIVGPTRHSPATRSRTTRVPPSAWI